MSRKFGAVIISIALAVVCVGVGYIIYDNAKKESLCHSKGGMYFSREQRCIKGKEIPLQ